MAARRRVVGLLPDEPVHRLVVDDLRRDDPVTADHQLLVGPEVAEVRIFRRVDVRRAIPRGRRIDDLEGRPGTIDSRFTHPAPCGVLGPHVEEEEVVVELAASVLRRDGELDRDVLALGRSHGRCTEEGVLRSDGRGDHRLRAVIVPVPVPHGELARGRRRVVARVGGIDGCT